LSCSRLDRRANDLCMHIHSPGIFRHNGARYLRFWIIARKYGSIRTIRLPEMLNSLDRQLLHLLTANARASVTELAVATKASRNTIRHRLERLVIRALRAIPEIDSLHSNQ